METLDTAYAEGRPSVSEEAAARLALEHWGVEGQARECASERDRVFEISGSAGVAGFLKVSNALEERAVLDAEAAMLAALSESQSCYTLPTWRPALEGGSLIKQRLDGRAHFVRFLETVPGIPLDRFRPHGPELRRQIGRLAGILDRSTTGVTAANRPMVWDLRRAASLIRENLAAIESPARREIIATILERHRAYVAPRVAELRESLIYNDANPANIHVDPGRMREGVPHIVGVVDFGDAIRSWTVANLAVASAYAAFGSCDPLSAFCDVARGYAAEHEMTEAEADVVYELARLRLALSVTVSSVRGAPGAGQRLPAGQPGARLGRARTARGDASEPGAVSAAGGVWVPTLPANGSRGLRAGARRPDRGAPARPRPARGRRRSPST